MLWSNVLLGVAAAVIAAWGISLFMTPVPSWHQQLPILGIVCSVFASTLRRTARRREAADQARQL